MFSVKQKREIADAVQQILRATNHPELPTGEIRFHLHAKSPPLWTFALKNVHNGKMPSKKKGPKGPFLAAMFF